MRIFFFLLWIGCINAAGGQPGKPQIIGQRHLQVAQNQQLTIQLTDLEVRDSAGQPYENYPSGFMLEVFSGEYYSVSENTISPATDYAGNLTVPVRVDDGMRKSDNFNLGVAVYATNQRPVITAQASLTTQANTPITLSLSHLSVNDPDNTYPDDFTLYVSEGNQYSVSGTTVTPAPGFAGTLTVNVTVSDGQEMSDSFPLAITVEAAPNVKPEITGQSPLTVNQNESITIQLAHLQVTDPDSDYPGDFTLQVSTGDQYTVNGTTVTPASGYSGTLSVSVSVNDGEDTSDPFPLAITVEAAPNVKPDITGQSTLIVNQNESITIQLAHLQVTDPDNDYPEDFTLQVSAGEHYTVDGATVKPASGYTGTLTVKVTVSDGKDTSDPFPLAITVQAAPNVSPEITGQSPLSVRKNESITVLFSHLRVTDPDNDYPEDFTLKLYPGNNYTLAGHVVTPVENFTGTLSVIVTVHDGTAESNRFNLAITVEEIPNAPPRITGQVPLSLVENQSMVIELAHLVVTDPDNAYPGDFSLTVLPGDHYNTSGQVITPSSNFTGTLSVGVTVNDGTHESEPFYVKITVTPTPNIRPVITGQAGVTTLKNSPVRIELSQLTVADPDNTYPDDFTLSVSPGSDYSVSGSVVTPAREFTGVLTVNVRVNDGELSSEPFGMRVEVIDRGELQILGHDQLTVQEDSKLTLTLDDLIVHDPDNAYPNGFTMTVSPGDDYAVSGTTLTPAADFVGNLSVNVTVGNGSATSSTFALLVQVTPVNDPPVMKGLPVTPLMYTLDSGPIYVAEEVTITDVDDESLFFAAISFAPGQFQPGADELMLDSAHSIRAVFDRNEGTLIMIGEASLMEYQQVIRSVQYNFIPGDTARSPRSKTLYFEVNDGQQVSEVQERMISFTEQVDLDIPTAFTPNNDNANDTWRVKPLNNAVFDDRSIIRVYNKRGVLVFESTGFEHEWDGRLRGERLPADTYFYTIELDSPYFSKRYKGVVMILY